MKVLVVGQGGREHALVRALRLSVSVEELHVLPGSDGMEREAKRHLVDWRDFGAVCSLIRQLGIDLVVIGPDDPAPEGLSDAIREMGCKVFGPSRAAAQLEASKLFAKRFMVAAGVPTARFYEVASVDDVLREAKNFKPPYVLKADGLAAGKGVFICKDETELRNAADEIFIDKKFQAAGATALLEEFQPGYEISCLVLTNGVTWEPLVLAADHKRLLDDDRGPNTGGMGTVAPYEIDSKVRERIDREILAPVMQQMQKAKLYYRGVLYVGLMVTDKGPNVLEFNARFGDPETQVIMPLLDGDWGQAMMSIASGDVPKLKWKKEAAACVVLAAEGYPESPRKGVRIEGEILSETNDSYFLHAGTARKGDTWTTNGGRVLNAIGIGSDVKQALNRAYAQARKVTWPGVQVRTDIGKRVLSRS